MKKTALHVALAGALFFSLSSVYGQRWEIGANAGASGYMGDINPTNPIYFRSGNVGLSGQYNIDPTWGIHANLGFLHISGSDSDFDNRYQQERKQQFSNNMGELMLTARFNFFKFAPGVLKRKFTPLLLVGVAGVIHSPYVSFQDQRYYLRNLMIDQKDYQEYNPGSTVVFSIPLGFGAKYALKKSWTIGAEVIYRIALSDRLDNISGKYAYRYINEEILPYSYLDLPSHIKQRIDEDSWRILADPSGNIRSNYGKYRGNSSRHDAYITANITLTYAIQSANCSWW